MRSPLVIYDFATAPFWTSLYMRKILIYFYQCGGGLACIKQPKKGEGPQRACSAVYHLDKLKLA
jgi:hypothetical protein